MRILRMICLALLTQIPQAGAAGQGKGEVAGELEKSSYFAFVDRDYIFTMEVVAPGVPLLNFVSMTEDTRTLAAKQIRVVLETRKVPGRSFLVDTGDPKEPLVIASLTLRTRSSFGVRLQGDFGSEKEFVGVIVQLGQEDLKLAPLTSMAFENLVLKVNRINLGSPNFRDDWQAVKLETIGTRSPAPRR